jgi:hypothetical protein
VGNIEIDDVRRGHRVGEDQPRTVRRDVADQAVGDATAVVEIDHAAQKAFLARNAAALGRSAFGWMAHGRRIRRRTLTIYLTIRNGRFQIVSI